jgi:biofilm PGA synthesis N-glycosyltransferase PgaC
MTTLASPQVLIVTPARDEAEWIERTIQSLLQQTHRPARWIIVNDGSSDQTGEIAERYAAEYTWIQVIHRAPGAPRRVGPGVIEAFYTGLQSQDLCDFDYVCKMDADIELLPGYFQNLMERFAADRRLGTISGKCWVPLNGQLVAERTGDQFSHGVCKLYRRECFEEIGGFVREVMWDGIDCHSCRMLGWKAVSDADPNLRIIHLRLMGSSFRSVYHGRRRWGRGQYFMGTHPLYLLGITAYRMLERPYILGGLCILAGYLGAWFRNAPQYGDEQFRGFLHRWQLSRIGLRSP